MPWIGKRKLEHFFYAKVFAFLHILNKSIYQVIRAGKIQLWAIYGIYAILGEKSRKLNLAFEKLFPSLNVLGIYYQCQWSHNNMI